MQKSRENISTEEYMEPIENKEEFIPTKENLEDLAALDGKHIDPKESKRKVGEAKKKIRRRFGLTKDHQIDAFPDH